MHAIGEVTAVGHQTPWLCCSWTCGKRSIVSHEFLLALNRFGVGSSCEWVALCYRKINIRLLVNGEMVVPLPIRRSVWQGCPLSPILFVLQLKPICREVNEDSHI